MFLVIRKIWKSDYLRTTAWDPYLFPPFLIILSQCYIHFLFLLKVSFHGERRVTSHSGTLHIFQIFHLRKGVLFSAFHFKYLYEKTLTGPLFTWFTQSLTLRFGKWEYVWSSLGQVPAIVQTLSSGKRNYMGRGCWYSLPRVPLQRTKNWVAYTTEIYCLPGLEAQSLKLSCHQVWFPWRTARDGSVPVCSSWPVQGLLLFMALHLACTSLCVCLSSKFPFL